MGGATTTKVIDSEVRVNEESKVKHRPKEKRQGREKTRNELVSIDAQRVGYHCYG